MYMPSIRLNRSNIWVSSLWGHFRGSKDYFLILFLSVVFVLLWFRNGALAIGGDYVPPFHPLQWLERYLFAWNSWVDAGFHYPPVLDIVPLLDDIILSTCAAFGLTLSDSQKLYVALLYFVGSASTYYLTFTLMHKYKGRRIISFFSALFYLYNPFLILNGYKSIVGSLVPRAFLPLFLGLYVKGLQTRNIKYAALVGLTSLPLVCVFPRFEELFFATIFLSIYTLFYIANLIKTNRARLAIKFVIKFLFIVGTVFIVVNLYWLVPFFEKFSTFSTTVETFPVKFVASRWATVLNVLRLFGDWPFFEGYVPYAPLYLENPFIVVMTFALPIMAFSALLLNPRNKSVILFSFITVIALFFAKGVNPPFGEIYGYLVHNILFFRLVYNSWVFIELISLLYCFDIGVSCGGICERVSSIEFAVSLKARRKLYLRLKPIVVFLLAVMIIGISWPLVTGDVFTNWYQPDQKGVNVPQYYFDTSKWLNDQQGCFRVLIIPSLGHLQYVANHWGFQGPNAFYRLMFTVPLITGGGITYGFHPSYTSDFIRFTYRVPIGACASAFQDILQLENCDSIKDFILGSEEMEMVDEIAVDQEKYVEGSGSLRWTIDKSLYAPNGHQVVLKVAQHNWLNYSTLGLWLSCDYRVLLDNGLQVGVEDFDGNVEWFIVNKYIVAGAQWNEVTMEFRKPDLRFSDTRKVRNVILRYDTSSMNESGKTTIWVDDIRISGGTSSIVFAKMLALLNVKYVLIDTSVDSNMYQDLHFEPYLWTIDSSSAFTHVLENGSLKVYENKLFLPRIYGVSNLVFLRGNLTDMIRTMSNNLSDTRTSAYLLESQRGSEALPEEILGNPERETTIDFHRADPTRYFVHVRADAPFVLVFSETFDSGWKAEVEGDEIGEHFIVNGYANGWYIQKEGEYDITITFEPQKLSNLPKLVSTIGILACIIITLYISIWRRH